MRTGGSVAAPARRPRSTCATTRLRRLSSLSGSLLAAGAVKGTRAVTYAAQDKGGGVRREQLVVDGAVLAERARECSFALAVPCPLAVTGTLAVDTTRLAEGEHEATLLVADATLTGTGAHGPVRFVVDNVPPPASTSPPRISGTSTLYADDGAWSGTNLVYTRRWQRLDGSLWVDIPGPTARCTRRPPKTPGCGCGSRCARATPKARREAFSSPRRWPPGPPRRPDPDADGHRDAGAVARPGGLRRATRAAAARSAPAPVRVTPRGRIRLRAHGGDGPLE